jgi:predicted DNA-binding transcriptional regulator AlpA
MQQKPLPAVPVDDDVLIPSHLILERYGITRRTLYRWIADARMAFPRPVVLVRRFYFNKSEIESWERARASIASPAGA